MLGEVLELTFGCDLTIGPSLEEGFYYDCFLGERTLAEEDCRLVEKAMEKAVKVRSGSCALTRCLCSALLSLWQAGEAGVRARGGLPRRGAGHVPGEQIQG